jgi:hypothetical protein
MTLPSNTRRGELWYTDRGSTFNDSFTAASTFQGSATKLKFFDLDLSGLADEIVEDSAIQSAFEGKPGPIIARQHGTFSFKMWLEGGSSTTSPETVAALLGAVMGGLKSPTAISDAAEAASTSTQINATAHGMDENELVLVGVKGDSGGDGRVAPIEDATTSADYYLLQLALPAAPAATAVLKNGHTLYIDWADESYQDFLFMGSHIGGSGTDDPDQVQMIGCSATVEFGGFAEGAPWVQFNYMVGQRQWVNYADQASLQPATAASGNDPVGGQASGSFLFQDAGTTTRQAIPGDEVEIALNMELRPIKDHNYPNSIGGWVKVPSAPGVGPTISMSCYWANLADMPGLYDDYSAKTAKQVLYQMGYTAQDTVAFYMQNATMRPVDPANRVDLEDSTAIKLSFVGAYGGVTDLATDAKKLEDAAMVIWFG